MLFVIPSSKMGASYSNTLRISDRRVQGRSPGSFVSRTTAFYLHPAIVWEREGVTPSQGGPERTADYCFTLRTTAIYSRPATVRGCGGIIPPRGQGAKPLGHSRAFSGVYGERATSMTKCGKHARVRSTRNAGVPAGKIFDFSRGVKVRPKWRLKAAILRLVGNITRLPTTSCPRRGR